MFQTSECSQGSLLPISVTPIWEPICRPDTCLRQKIPDTGCNVYFYCGQMKKILLMGKISLLVHVHAVMVDPYPYDMVKFCLQDSFFTSLALFQFALPLSSFSLLCRWHTVQKGNDILPKRIKKILKNARRLQGSVLNLRKKTSIYYSACTYSK